MFNILPTDHSHIIFIQYKDISTRCLNQFNIINANYKRISTLKPQYIPSSYKISNKSPCYIPNISNYLSSEYLKKIKLQKKYDGLFGIFKEKKTKYLALMLFKSKYTFDSRNSHNFKVFISQNKLHSWKKPTSNIVYCGPNNGIMYLTSHYCILYQLKLDTIQQKNEFNFKKIYREWWSAGVKYQQLQYLDTYNELFAVGSGSKCIMYNLCNEVSSKITATYPAHINTDYYHYLPPPISSSCYDGNHSIYIAKRMDVLIHIIVRWING